jgi:hypothetical protein
MPPAGIWSARPLKNGHRCRVADHRVDVAILARASPAQRVSRHKCDFPDVLLFEERKAEDGTHDETRATLIDVEAHGIIRKTQSTLDQITRRGDQLIRRLADKDERVDLLAREQPLVEKPFEGRNRQVGGAGGLLCDAMCAEAHHLFKA